MEEKERFEYYLAQNQLYDKTNDELYCFGIEQDKTRLVDFLNLMNEDWWALYIRNKELREENQQLKQQLAEKRCEICGSKMILGELGYYCNNDELHPIYPAPNEAKSDYEEITLLKQDYDAIVEREELLRQQLAEKDKEIEKLNACVDFYKSYYISFKDKVIDELEKVKNYIITDEKDIFGANYLMKSGYVLDFIDNQIKELKKELK